MPLYDKLLLYMAVLAVCSDLHTEKIPNSGIVSFWVTGLLYQIAVNGWQGILTFIAGAAVPVIALLLLFVFRMLGSGDIKLLSALGGVMGPLLILKCIFCSFVIGAGISLFILIMAGILFERLRYFTNYFRNYLSTKTIVPYRITGKRLEHIHFSVPVLLAVMLHTGGIY